MGIHVLASKVGDLGCPRNTKCVRTSLYEGCGHIVADGVQPMHSLKEFRDTWRGPTGRQG